MPRVTFIVPCYKLAHLLGDCVTSILNQTFQDFEVLIMDDCSPDDTPKVARSFDDPRVVHVRNEPNLGHLRNYNKGIDLAKGDFIWLISADDCLRGKDVLARYVEVMDEHPRVGFVFCPAITLKNGREEGLVPWATSGSDDFVMPGREYLPILLTGNKIAAPSAMARRECYAIEQFPLDMPYSGDWYMWLRFLLDFDVAYFAEPMAYYRIHDSNMTWEFLSDRAVLGIRDELRAVFRLLDVACQKGDREVEALCEQKLIDRAAKAVVSGLFDAGQPGLSREQLQTAFDEGVSDAGRRRRLVGAVCRRVGDYCYWKQEPARAREYYADARRALPGDLGTLAREGLLRLGRVGRALRSLSSRAQSAAPLTRRGAA